VQNPYTSVLTMQDACNASGVMMSGPSYVEAVATELRRFELYSTDNFKRHPVVILYADKLADLAGIYDRGAHDGLSYAYDVCDRLRDGVLLNSPDHKALLEEYYNRINKP
jgi:hypothetical protein